MVAKPDFVTKVKARTRFSPALVITGQMYGPWRYTNASILAGPSVDVAGKATKNEKGIHAIDVSGLIPDSYLVKLKNKSLHMIKK